MSGRARPSPVGASLWAPAAMLAAWLLASVVLGHGILFSRPLWLDEYHTVLVASRVSPAQVVRDLAAGVDLAPPLLHGFTWVVRQIVDTLTPTLLHGLSFAAVSVGLAFTYATLRRQFDATSSIAGAMAVGSHALVVSHAFEARYYGPWAMLCAFFCWAIGLREPGRRRDALVAIAAVLVCTIHWFGGLTLALMCAGATAALARDNTTAGARDRAWRLLRPAGAGVIALTVCAPLLIAQRAHFTTPMWVPDLDRAQLIEMTRTFFFTVVPIAAALILLASTFSEAPAWRHARSRLHDPGIAAMAALALMPVAITIVSALVQPAMLPRYATGAALAWAPLAALAATVLGPAQRYLWCAVLAAAWWVNLTDEVEAKRDFSRSVQDDVRAFDQSRQSGVPVVFQSRHVLYPVAARREALRAQMSLLVLPDSLLDSMFGARSGVAEMARFFRFERDAVQRHVEVYAFPRLIEPSALEAQPRFILIGSDASLPRGYKDVERFGRAVFPDYRVTRVRDDIAVFQRQ